MMENKHESEINVVRELIELLDLTDVVFTFDALHCQKKPWKRSPLQVTTTQLKLKPINNSYRKVEVFEPPKNLDPQWIGVGSVIKVERSGTRGNESYQRIGYYLCSLSPQSRRLADGIRGHWLIENSLHWVKDVIYDEDISPQKAGLAPRNLSLLKTWVLTLLRVHGFESIKSARA